MFDVSFGCCPRKRLEPCGANIVEWHSMIMSGVMNHSQYVTIMSVLLSVPKEAIDFERRILILPEDH